jgi:DNA-binding transcriptional LysR family regulator
MRVEYLKYLVEVADCGSMSKAAKNLYVTQPAVSNAISALEEEIGWPILKRTVGGVEATTKGKLVVDDARVIVKLVKDWNNKLASPAAQEEIAGDVYIADVGEAGLTFFQDIVMEINKQYPKLVIHAVNPRNTLQELNNGRFQMAVLPIVPMHHGAVQGYLQHYRWQMDTLYQKNYQVLVSPQCPLAGKARLTLEDLETYPVLLHNQFPYAFRLGTLAEKTIVNYESTIKLITAVAMGEAVAFFPPSRDNMMREYEKAGLVATKEIDLDIPLEYDLIYSEYFSMTAAGQLIIESVKAQYAQNEN